MKHPNQSTLALFAGGDLGYFARWKTERHLANCDLCGAEVASFEAIREISTDLAEVPEVSWSGLEAEMKANIRLGLVAGECVRLADAPLRERRLFTGFRAAVALASIVTLVVTGVVLQTPAPLMADDHMVVQGIDNGIEVGGRGSAFRLMNTGATNVTFSVGAQGSMGARYVDPKTGYITINNVYAE